MAVGVLIAITLACIAWSLWIRRSVELPLGSRGDAQHRLAGAAVALMSPLASETIGRQLYNLTGKWNLEDYLGHDCYIVAASAIVYNALGRLQEDDALQLAFKQYVERPATLCIPLLLATFSFGNGATSSIGPISSRCLLISGSAPTGCCCAEHSSICWCTGRSPGAVADPAEGPPLAIHRQRLSAGLGRRSRGLLDPDHHGLRHPFSRWKAASWSGCSPASAAPVSPWPPRIPGGSR